MRGTKTLMEFTYVLFTIFKTKVPDTKHMYIKFLVNANLDTPLPKVEKIEKYLLMFSYTNSNTYQQQC